MKEKTKEQMKGRQKKIREWRIQKQTNILTGERERRKKKLQKEIEWNEKVWSRVEWKDDKQMN